MAITKFTIKSEYHNISLVSKKIKTFLNESKVNFEVIEAIQISLMEALNNSIEHSYLEKPGNDIDIIVSVTPSRVEINIVETGLPRTNFEKPKLEFDPDDLTTAPEGGMGLYIIDTLMDGIDYTSENGVNTTTFYKFAK